MGEGTGVGAWELSAVAGAASSEGLLLSLFLLLQNRIVTETVSFVMKSMFTGWLWGERAKMGEQVYNLPPQG